MLLLYPDIPWVFGGFFRTDYGGRHGPGTQEAVVLELIQTETGTPVSQVGGETESTPQHWMNLSTNACSVGQETTFHSVFFHSLRDPGTSPGLSVSVCSVWFLSLIVVILKGNDSMISVLLRKQWVRQSFLCDYGCVNFKYLFIYLIDLLW